MAKIYNRRDPTAKWSFDFHTMQLALQLACLDIDKNCNPLELCKVYIKEAERLHDWEIRALK